MTQEHKVTFQQSGKSVFVLPGTSLLEAAARAGIILQTPCGGQGHCGKCKAKIITGECAATSACRTCLGQNLVDQGFRLSCQARVWGDLVMDVPTESLFEHKHKILVSNASVSTAVEPNIRKIAFELEKPSQEHSKDDLDRLKVALGPIEVPHAVGQYLPRFLRQNRWKGTAVIGSGKLVSLEKGNTTSRLFGVAFDIGTTTIVGTLMDLATGNDCAVASSVNPQIPYGDDVVSRIQCIRKKPENLSRLQSVVQGTLGDLIKQLCDKASISRTEVYDVVVTGNTTMQQIFCGFDPSALGEIPFVPAFREHQTIPAASLNLNTNPLAQVHVFGQIGGFVGGDTVAGMLAVRIDQWERPVLFVDIGTNGEIVLYNNGQLLAASTAAGPAFEGARIRQGMRAMVGAIEKVVIRQDQVLLNVIGNTSPLGICGTGLIDAVASMLEAGLLDSSGRIVAPGKLGPDVPLPLRNRLRPQGHDIDFVLTTPRETGGEDAVAITQRDIRELQLASGAIRAGIHILLKKAGLAVVDLEAVLLAGAFGNFIRRGNARRIGLLPNISKEKIRFVGNAASMGAKMALLSVQERAYAEALRKKTVHVDLSLDPEFQIEYGNAMIFPKAP